MRAYILNGRFAGYEGAKSVPDGATLVDVVWEHSVFEGEKGIPVVEGGQVKMVISRKRHLEILESKRQEAKSTADSEHQTRLSAGFPFGGVQCPCLKDDRAGVNGVIAGFQIGTDLYDAYVEANGEPDLETKIAIAETGAVAPEFQTTQFNFTTGDWLELTPETAKQLAGIMGVFVSRSFIQRQAREAEMLAPYEAVPVPPKVEVL